MIGEHFAIRSAGRLCYRDAQGVLRLPADLTEYLRGRHRQAVRTNVGHARRAGLRAAVEFVPDWAPGAGDSRLPYITPGPVERWNLLTPEGTIVAQAILSVDEEVALLQGLMSLVPHGRWLLHTAMVERLCGACEMLLINCDDAYLMTPGVQYFQRLLGYDDRPAAAPSFPATEARNRARGRHRRSHGERRGMRETSKAEASGFEQHRYAPPADSVEVVLVRHGASEAALPGVSFPMIDGQGDPALSEVGRSQARSVAAELGGEEFSGLFVSTLRRTQETAAPLVERTGLDVRVLPDLREVFLGELEGGEYRIKVAEGDPLVAGSRGRNAGT